MTSPAGRESLYRTISVTGDTRGACEMSNRGVGEYAESHIGNGKRDRSNLGSTAQEKTAIGETPLQEAGLQALRLYLRRVRKSLVSLEDADDAATIHDARVAVRELR